MWIGEKKSQYTLEAWFYHRKIRLLVATAFQSELYAETCVMYRSRKRLIFRNLWSTHSSVEFFVHYIVGKIAKISEDGILFTYTSRISLDSANTLKIGP